MIKNLADILKANVDFKNVVAITAAKVPIVKFDYFYKSVLYEGDISYYNILGKRVYTIIYYFSTQNIGFSQRNYETFLTIF